MILFFNSETQSIVAKIKDHYYDMRNGKEILHPKMYYPLNRYKKVTVSKPVFSNDFPDLTLKKHYIKNQNGQLSGNFPRYFWKGLYKIQNLFIN